MLTKVTGASSNEFDNVAAMIAAGLRVGNKVRTLGYYSAGDGGGNDYEIVAAATGTDDGGEYIDLTTHQAKGLFVSGKVGIKMFGAKCDGVSDDTAKVQAAMDFSLAVSFPKNSVTVIDPSTSLIVRQGQNLFGAGLDSTIIHPTAVGGAVFKRVATATDSSYVRNVVFDGIGIVFNHPATAAPANYEQIGFDVRSISRAVVRNCYAGNYNRGPLRGTRTDPALQANAAQGYGVIAGTDNTNYAGGEIPTIEGNQFYGCKKCIVVDDITLDPLSACYAATIYNNDIQIAETGIAIEQQYNAGSIVIDNTVQAILQATGSSNTTYAYRMAGRDSFLRNKYIEVTVADCDYILKMDSTAKRNVCELGLIGNDDTFIALITDSGGWGNHNRINYAVPSTNKSVLWDGTVDSELGRDKARVLFDAVGAIQGAAMRVSSVTRNATGDFTINFDTNTFPDVNYNFTFDFQIDTAGSGGSATVRTLSTTSIRVIFRNAAGSVVDPLRASIRCG